MTDGLVKRSGQEFHSMHTPPEASVTLSRQTDVESYERLYDDSLELGSFEIRERYGVIGSAPFWFGEVHAPAVWVIKPHSA